MALNVPNNLPLSGYLLKQCKLWVWDFDDTLIDTDTYMKKNMSPDSIAKRTDAELDKEIPQWRYFSRLVEFLATHGKYIGIASFGTYDIIQAYMNRIMGFNQHYFTKKNIIAPCMSDRQAFRFNIPPDKNEYVYTLMRIYRVQDFKSVVLFDDNASNIASAIAIGIIAIQIATVSNGDNPNSNKLLFGPWIMSEFDNKIKTTCGTELYQNKTYTGITTSEYSEINKDKNTYNTMNNYTTTQNINFGTGIRAKDNYMQEPYMVGMDSDNDNENSIYPVAFGTGIGNRKILTKPEYRWNGYKNSLNNIPKWKHGNYINVPNLVNTKGYWNYETIIGGTQQHCDDEKKQSIKNINTTDINEHFTNDNNNSCNCKPIKFNWIILLLILLFILMIVLCIY